MSIRTLVVDDDAHVADVHRAYVARIDGFAPVGVVHRGAEALAAVAAGGVDLVLLDLYLPDGHGLDVCRALRPPAGARTDVIAVTAARDVATVHRAVGQGVVQYLVKPFPFATFRDKLERYAAFRAGVTGRREADQAEVDALLGELRAPSAAPALPKGLSRPTYDLVAGALQAADGERSAVEIAEACGVSRVTARRYLEHLVGEGRAELSMRYGSSGRPEHRYAWTR
ncbi:response regulator [Patulibacter sp. SYSU D01012]|uniref:response regulator n=1 Tax=Patulibacter sp. SYSU D01012 TaxID=2817381 RepID=UPI001B3055A8|nr:response regulator [Patulibacter sp. SYSU D01012]